MQARLDWVLIIFGTQVKKKKRPVWPVFPVCRYVSYDYEQTHKHNAFQLNIFRLIFLREKVC